MICLVFRCYLKAVSGHKGNELNMVSDQVRNVKLENYGKGKISNARTRLNVPLSLINYRFQPSTVEIS